MAVVEITVDYDNGQVKITREGPGVRSAEVSDVREVPALLIEAAEAAARSLNLELPGVTL